MLQALPNCIAEAGEEMESANRAVHHVAIYAFCS